MESTFWIERWREGRIGFHRSEVNPVLTTHREVWLGPSPPRGRVLVPLCGKSLDLLWLEGQGFDVTGVDVAPRAARDFHLEHERPTPAIPDGPFVRHESGRIRYLSGDVLHLRPTDVEDVRWIWDRAALVALPPELRRRYVSHLRTSTAPGTRLLLSSIVFPPGELGPPPHSVAESEIRELFDGASIRRLSQTDLLSEPDAPTDPRPSQLLREVWLVVF